MIFACPDVAGAGKGDTDAPGGDGIEIKREIFPLERSGEYAKRRQDGTQRIWSHDRKRRRILRRI